MSEDVTRHERPPSGPVVTEDEPARVVSVVSSYAAPTPAGVKPGWRCSEFWLAAPLVAAAVIALLTTTTPDLHQAIMVASTTLAAAALVIGYTASRTHLKASGEGTSLEERHRRAERLEWQSERARLDAHERWRARAHHEAVAAVAGRRPSGAVEHAIPTKGI